MSDVTSMSCVLLLCTDFYSLSLCCAGDQGPKGGAGEPGAGGQKGKCCLVVTLLALPHITLRFNAYVHGQVQRAMGYVYATS